MQTYLDLLTKCLTKGELQANRTGINTYSLFGESIEVPVGHLGPDGVITGLPLLTTKSVHVPSVVAELLWFLRGYTRVEYLQHHKCRIWNEWATKEQCEARGQTEGDLGPVYGKQWVQWGGLVPTTTVAGSTYDFKPSDPIYDDLTFSKDDDRVAEWCPPEILDRLTNLYWQIRYSQIRDSSCMRWKTNEKLFYRDITMAPGFDDFQRNNARLQLKPGHSVYAPDTVYFSDTIGMLTLPIDQIDNAIQQIRKGSRRAIVSAWNPTDVDKQGLPPCHAFFQFVRIGDKLNLHLYQRSCDVFLGLPFNMASYALLLHMIAYVTKTKPGNLKISFGDAHLYENHVPQAMEQIRRKLITSKSMIKTPMASVYPLAEAEPTPGLPWFNQYTPDLFMVRSYPNHGKIKAEVAV